MYSRIPSKCFRMIEKAILERSNVVFRLNNLHVNYSPNTHIIRMLIYLHLFTELFRKDFSTTSFIRTNTDDADE